MKIDFAFICDYADVISKINALGIGFDTIYAAKVPIKHPLFYLVIQLRANIVEAGEKDLEVDIIDENGKGIIPAIRAKIPIRKPPAGTESIGRIAVAFRDVEFPHYGSYSLHVVVVKIEMVRVPFRVSPPPQISVAA